MQMTSRDMKKMLNITHHQGNTNPQGDTTSHLSELLKLTTQETADVDKDAEEG